MEQEEEPRKKQVFDRCILYRQHLGRWPSKEKIAEWKKRVENGENIFV